MEDKLKKILNSFPSSFETFDFVQKLGQGLKENILNRLVNERQICIYDDEMEDLRDLNFIAFLYYSLRQHDIAIKNNNDSLQRNRHNINALACRAWFHLYKSEFSACNEICEELEELKQDKLQLLVAKAEVGYAWSRLGMKKYKDAERMFNEALNGSDDSAVHVPEHYICTWKFGLALTIRRQFNIHNLHLENIHCLDSVKERCTKALDLFNDIIQMDGVNLSKHKARSYVQIGDLLNNNRNNPEMFDKKLLDKFNGVDIKQKTRFCYEEGLKIQPRDVFVLERCAKYFRLIRQVNRSIELCNHALSIRETSFTHHCLARALQLNLEFKLHNKNRSRRTNTDSFRPFQVTPMKREEKTNQGRRVVDMVEMSVAEQVPVHSESEDKDTTKEYHVVRNLQSDLDVCEQQVPPRVRKLDSGIFSMEEQNTLPESEICVSNNSSKISNTTSELAFMSETPVKSIDKTADEGDEVSNALLCLTIRNQCERSNAVKSVEDVSETAVSYFRNDSSEVRRKEMDDTGRHQYYNSLGCSQGNRVETTENDNKCKQTQFHDEQNHDSETLNKYRQHKTGKDASVNQNYQACNSSSINNRSRRRPHGYQNAPNFTQYGNRYWKPSPNRNYHSLMKQPQQRGFYHPNHGYQNTPKFMQYGYRYLNPYSPNRNYHSPMKQPQQRGFYHPKHSNVNIEEVALSKMVKSPKKVSPLPPDQIGEIIKHLDRAVDLNENTAALYDKGLVLRAACQYDDALDVFKLMFCNPRSSLVLLANAYEQAALCLNEMCKIKTDKEKIEIDLKVYLLKCIEIQCNLVAKVPQLRSCWSSFPTLKSLLEEKPRTKFVLKELGHLHEKVQNYSEAIGWFQQALQAETESYEKVSTHMDIVNNSLKAGNYNEAILHIDMVLCFPDGRSKVDEDLYFKAHIEGGLEAFTAGEKEMTRLRLKNALDYKRFDENTEQSDAGDEEASIKQKWFDVFILCDQTAESLGRKVLDQFCTLGLDATLNDDLASADLTVLGGISDVIDCSTHSLVVLGENMKNMKYIKLLTNIINTTQQEHGFGHTVVVTENENVQIDPMFRGFARMQYDEISSCVEEYVPGIKNLLLMLASGLCSKEV